MKIMFYINTICHGGAERVICNLATQFSECGHSCILVTSFSRSLEYTYGSKVCRVNLFENPIETNFLFRNIRLVKQLRNLLADEQPDVLISFMAEPNFRAIIASMGLKNKVVISIRNDPNKEYGNIMTRMLSKLLFRCADGIVFQTEDAQKWFPKAIQKKSKIIYNQVDEVFYNTKFEGECHDVVATGRLVPQKNHKLLIRAFSAIADKISDNLIIYGEGGLRCELEKLIADLHMENRIFLPGCVENVAEIISSAKLFVLSSSYEGMPNSLMEAMALGLPCISVDCPCGGPRMLLGDAENIYLVPPDNVDAFSKKMYIILTDKEENNIARKYAVEKSRQFHPEIVIKHWLNYLFLITNKEIDNNYKF